MLSPSRLACLRKIPTVNLTNGCAHGCVYCYTRGYSTYPGEGTIRLYTNTLARLREELPRKRNKPSAVYFSPASDLFQPVPEVLDAAYDVLEFLFRSGVGVTFLTKGRIPERHMELLKGHAPLVAGQIGLTTLDEEILRTFEPYAAPPRVRLAQAKELLEHGIATRVRLDPVLPGLTDDPKTLQALLAALAEIGIKCVAASVLFLRPAVVGSLRRHIEDTEILHPLLDGFAAKVRLRIRAGDSVVGALPREARREIYDRLIAIAKDHGIEVRLCACKNPDIAHGTCSIAAAWSTPAEAKQLDLFGE